MLVPKKWFPIKSILQSQPTTSWYKIKNSLFFAETFLSFPPCLLLFFLHHTLFLSYNLSFHSFDRKQQAKKLCGKWRNIKGDKMWEPSVIRNWSNQLDFFFKEQFHVWYLICANDGATYKFKPFFWKPGFNDINKILLSQVH